MENSTLSNNDNRKRELYEGYVQMLHNPCWQWLYESMTTRRGYLWQRLLHAADWSEYCALSGKLETIDVILAQLVSLAAEFEDRREEEKHDL